MKKTIVVRQSWILALAAGAALMACSGKEVGSYYTPDVGSGGTSATGGTATTDAASPSGGTTADASTAGGGTGGTGAGGSTTDAGTGGQPVAPVVPFEGGCADDNACGAGVKCVLGVCVKPPPQNLKANFACDDALVDGSDPDFSCWDAPQAVAADGPAEVPMRGRIDFFGDGNVTKELTVKIYTLDQFDPTPCLGVADGQNEIDRARDAIEACIDEHNQALAETVSHICTDDPTKGCYELDAVPTRKQLVIRVYGERRLWVPTYEYGVFLNPCVLDQFKEDSTCPEQRPDAAPDTNWSCSLKADDAGVYAPNGLNVLSKTTWTTFPPTAGVPRIQVGHGAVAGRSYDCQGRPVVNASVGFSNPGPRTTYFNGNPDDTLPQPGLDHTNLDATYANLDTPPGLQGIVQVAWQGTGADRKLKVVNFNRVYLLPDTLIILSPSGRDPLDTVPLFH